MHSFLLLAVLVLVAVAENTPSASSTHADYAGTLGEIQAKRELALRDIEQLPDDIPAEVDKVIAELEKFASGEEMRKEFEAHYSEVERLVSSVGIRDERSNPGTWFAMLKSPVSDGALKVICSEFAEDVQKALTREHERFEELYTRRHTAVMQTSYEDAQKRLREKCDQVIGQYFEVWSKGPSLPRVPPPPMEVPDPATTTGPGIPGISGVIILVFRKTLQRIVSRVLVKVGGKVLAKLIPIIGLLLLLAEVYDLATSKAKLESQMRQTFMEEYKVEFTPAVVWKEAESDLRKRVEEGLKKWSEDCKSEARKVLGAAEMLEAPGMKQWLEEKAKGGQDFDIVLQQMMGVCEVFGSLSLKYEPSLLIEILAFAPDKAELRALVKELDSRVVDEYKKSGSDFLKAAHHLGIPLFLDVLKDPKLDWNIVYAALESLPASTPDVEKTGVLNAMRAGIDPRSLNIDHRRELGAIAPKAVEKLADACEDRDKLRELLIDSKLRRPAEALLKDDPALAAAWLTHRPSNDLLGLERDDDRKACVELWRYRKEQRNCTAEDYVNDVNSWEISTWKEYDKDGIEISDAYLSTSPGEHQYEQAQRAIKLHDSGVVKAALTRPELLTLAYEASFIPVVGIPAFNTIYPVLPGVQWATTIIAVFLPLLVLAACALVLWPRIIRKFRKSSSPDSPHPSAAGVALKAGEPIHVKLTVASNPAGSTAPLPPHDPVPLLGDSKHD